jgi:hypothetical protein
LKLEDEKRALKQALERHRIEADQAHKYYVDTGKKCAAEWGEIRDLERSTSLTDEEEERLAVLKNKFTDTIAADYLMSKLVPYWGLSPQPGSTYYLQKLGHAIYVIVNHETSESTVYLRTGRDSRPKGPHNLLHDRLYFEAARLGEPCSFVFRQHVQHK